MDDTYYDRAWNILYPGMDSPAKKLTEKGKRFVQYTSADCASNIITGKSVWLRSVRSMNDHSEVLHGHRVLLNAIKDEEVKNKFHQVVSTMYPEAIEKIYRGLDNVLDQLIHKTFITCVSEHLPGESNYGRLSMWRAYGGDAPVALIFKPEAILGEKDILHSYCFPVEYRSDEDMVLEMHRVIDGISTEKDSFSQLGEEVFVDYMRQYFKDTIICSKHPAFAEEKEWRVVYNPTIKPSKYVRRSIKSINGVPQEIHEIKLKGIPEEEYLDLEIPNLLDGIMIGPCADQELVAMAFIDLLTDAGVKSPGEKVRVSGVPLRRS